MKKPIDVKLTPEGFKKLQDEQSALTEKRPVVLRRMVAAREQGDLSENAGYHAAKEELGYIDSRVKQVKLLIRFGEVVKAKNKDVISLGSKVRARVDGNEVNFFIVGELEADPIKSKLSNVSPIGKALLGKRLGDIVNVEIPDGKVTYTVVSIE